MLPSSMCTPNNTFGSANGVPTKRYRDCAVRYDLTLHWITMEYAVSIWKCFTYGTRLSHSVFQQPRGGGRHTSATLNFHQISHRFIRSFVNPSFQDLNGSYIMYWNIINLNPSRFTFEPHSKYWYFCIQIEAYFHYASRKTPWYFTLNGCAENPREMWIGRHIVTRRYIKVALLLLLLYYRGDSLSLTCTVC